MQVLVKLVISKNLFNKVMSFCLRFVTKRDFDCEQVEQQTSQPEMYKLFDFPKSRLKTDIIQSIINQPCSF